ncbi:conserved oligomeric Golgi complex subunit 6-like [Oscarella lobularis]|uniref:conserved oligomeric Golgi complex subunit 6-like n=1 Tax=Oscarella lobularis TaxID=121494 RepID=UPI003313842F
MTDEANPLSRKLAKVLSTRLDGDKDMMEALKGLSLFFTENTLKSRRSLRSDIERRSLTINEEFAREFGQIKEGLVAIEAEVKQMSEVCEDMKTRLRAAKEHTADLMRQTTDIQLESQNLELRSDVASAYLSHFQLEQDELEALKTALSADITMNFFKALEKVKSIHSKCHILLRNNQQRTGLEIMEAMALHEESAYERLYRWTQQQCRGLTTDVPEVSPAFSHALKALNDRTVLYKYSLDEMASARRAAVVRMFIDALTRGGGSSGTSRPIELHSHDPLRYVGDMLAWIHQAFVSEKELLMTLLSNRKDHQEESPVPSMLSYVSEGMSRPLKVRVEQILASEHGAPVLYKIANLLQFYEQTIGLVGMSKILAELHGLTMKMFFSSLNHYATELTDKIELPSADLNPCTAVNKTMTLLTDILQSHDVSVTPMDEKQAQLQKVLSSALDPLIQACSLSASGLAAADMAVYMINCIYLIQNTLALYESADHQLEMLKAQTDAHMDTVIHEQASYMLGKCGLARAHLAIEEQQKTKEPLSSMPGMDAESLRATMVQFDSYLSVPDSLILPQCHCLSSARLREASYKEAANMLCNAYEAIHKAVTEPANGYSDPGGYCLLRTPDQVAQLLG